MKKISLSAAILGTMLVPFLDAAPVEAQATRTWVSGVGDDVNPCSRTAPCKTFAGAISKTFTNGEINCLDPGGFGAVTITKSITIDCSNTQGSILASFVNGIIVNIAASANDPHRSVRLRGLTINGAGASGTIGTRTGINGINVTANGASSVFIENVTIGEFSQHGVRVELASGISLLMDDVTIRNTTIAGIKLVTTAGNLFAQLNNVRVYNAVTGLQAAGLARASIHGSVFSTGSDGIQTLGSGNNVSIDNTRVTFYSRGIRANPGSTIRLSSSFVVQNGTGIDASGGALISLSHNSVEGNTTDGVFTGTEPKQ